MIVSLFSCNFFSLQTAHRALISSRLFASMISLESGSCSQMGAAANWSPNGVPHLLFCFGSSQVTLCARRSYDSGRELLLFPLPLRQPPLSNGAVSKLDRATGARRESDSRERERARPFGAHMTHFMYVARSCGRPTSNWEPNLIELFAVGPLRRCATNKVAPVAVDKNV